MFHYSSYWHTWSRVLSFKDGVMTELNLTPVNPQWDWCWDEQVKPIRVRQHQTPLDYRDKMTSTLPVDIQQMVMRHVGEDLADRLLHDDILSLIDWGKFQKANNGGANLADIMKDTVLPDTCCAAVEPRKNWCTNCTANDGNPEFCSNVEREEL